MENIQLFKKASLFLFLFLLSSFCYAQVTEQWVKRYNGPKNLNDAAQALAIDASGNVYVTGLSNFSAGQDFDDYVTIKYDASGKELWVKSYNGTGNGQDEARSLALDGSGNVYVTGASIGSSNIRDYATIKYDANGNELWVRRYIGSQFFDGGARALTVDNSGNVYVTGLSIASGTDDNDFVTIKYDTNGNELWVKSYDGPNNAIDYAQSLVVDKFGNVYVTGYSGGESSFDYATIKYDANGNELWVRRYNGPANDWDQAVSLAVDDIGNVYVTGFSVGSGSSFDYATIKYDTNGNELWIKRHNGTGNNIDFARSLAVDLSGNVYVTGHSSNANNNMDYVSIKYDAAGNELWVRIYNGPENSFDRPSSMAVDAGGNVYVTGESIGIGTGNDYATIKYDTNGNELWIKRYDGPSHAYDYAQSLAVDKFGNVYVTGGSSDQLLDITTIKYTQTVAPPVQVTAGQDKTLYLGYGPNCVTLSAQASEGSPPYNYSWSPGGGTSANIKVCPTATTTYTVTVTDAAGQTASDEVKVNVIDVRCGTKGDKVLVCHKGKTLCISRNAVDAHLRHGDQLGGCNASDDLNSITENTDASQMMEETSKRFLVAVAPNPFSTAAKLQYELPADGNISIKVYDVIGREVATVVQAAQKAGIYSTGLNATDLAKGVYYYRALLHTKQKTYSQTGKLMVVK